MANLKNWKIFTEIKDKDRMLQWKHYLFQTNKYDGE